MGLDVSTWDDLKHCHPHDLYQLICAYDNYILYAFEDEEQIRSGWTPVSILEFANSEEFENMRGEFQ